MTVRGFLPSLGASLVMGGVAVTGMHCTAMAGVSVRLHDQGAVESGSSLAKMLVPMLIGPVLFILLAGVIVMFDPLLVSGEGLGNAPAGHRSGEVPSAFAKSGSHHRLDTSAFYGG
ncbi:hypothetical protein [Streptomyces adustus]